MDITNGFQIISSEVNEANKIICQIGYNEDGTIISQVNEFVFQQGFASIPIKAEQNTINAPSAMVIDDGSRKYVVATQDQRGNQFIKDLKAGEVVIYGAGEDGLSQGSIKISTEGAITLSTTSDNTKDGKPITISFTKDGFKLTSDTMELNIDTNNNLLTIGKDANEPLVTKTQFNEFVSKYNDDMLALSTHFHPATSGTTSKSETLNTVGNKSSTNGTNSIKVKD